MSPCHHKLFAVLLLASSLGGCKSADTGPSVDRASFKAGDPFMRSLYTISGDRAAKWILTHNEDHKTLDRKRRLSAGEIEFFWRSLDEGEVEKWRAQYQQTKFDGRTEYGDWQLNVIRKGVSIHSEGGEAFPNDLDPRKTTELRSTSRFEKVSRAFSTLFDP